MAEFNFLSFAYQLQNAIERLMTAVERVQEDKEPVRGWEGLGYARGKLDALTWAFMESGEDSFEGKAVRQILPLLQRSASCVDEDSSPTASIALVYVRNLIRRLEEKEKEKAEKEEKGK